MSVRKSLVAPKKAQSVRATKREERLAERRRRIRRVERIVLWGLGLSLVAGLVWVLWLPAIRVADIAVRGEIDGDRARAIEAMTQSSLAGFYGYVLPRDSIFLLSKNDIRTEVLATYPDIASVSVTRESFSALSVTVFPRVAAFVWCGAAREFSQPCFHADAEGFLFSDAASSTESLLTFYAPLEDVTYMEEPLRGRVLHAATQTPALFQLVHTLHERGLWIQDVVLRGDEADLYLRESDTRITYVLGDESGAAALIAIALENLPAPLAELEYIDVRFPGKAYFKSKE